MTVRSAGLPDNDSGRASVDVYCDLGTDCSDCGKWTGIVPSLEEEMISEAAK